MSSIQPFRSHDHSRPGPAKAGVGGGRRAPRPAPQSPRAAQEAPAPNQGTHQAAPVIVAPGPAGVSSEALGAASWFRRGVLIALAPESAAGVGFGPERVEDCGCLTWREDHAAHAVVAPSVRVPARHPVAEELATVQTLLDQELWRAAALVGGGLLGGPPGGARGRARRRSPTIC